MAATLVVVLMSYRIFSALLLVVALAAGSCKTQQCVDCFEPGTNHFFTFCDPPEPALDSLDCGAVYEKR